MAKTSSAHALRCTPKRMYPPGALYSPGLWQVGRQYYCPLRKGRPREVEQVSPEHTARRKSTRGPGWSLLSYDHVMHLEVKVLGPVGSTFRHS